jgi:hypothetical protein
MHSKKNIRGLRHLALVATAVCVTLGAQAVLAADSSAKQTISRSISKDLSDGQKALQAGQFADGLKHLETAAAVSGLTPYDKKTIAELKAYAYVKLNNYKAASQAYEDALATGAGSAEDNVRYTKAVFSLAANEQNYAKEIEYGKKLIDMDAANADTYMAITQTYFLQKDCKDAVQWADKSIAYARKAGELPKENYFKFKLQCAFDGNDRPATIAALEELIRLNSKSEYWNELLRFEMQDEKDDHNTLMIYRLMYNTDSMNSGSYFVEMAQLLADAPALPGEADAVLAKGLASGLITPDQKDRVARLEASLKGRADADHKGLTEFAAEAGKSGSGDLSVKLGEVYYGFGQYQDAVNAITSGLQKGGVKRLDDAYVYLGLSQQALKNIPEAKKAFQQLKTVPNINPKLLTLWLLYAEKLG